MSIDKIKEDIEWRVNVQDPINWQDEFVEKWVSMDGEEVHADPKQLHPKRCDLKVG